MATTVYFKRQVRDYARLEDDAGIALGTTHFSGDGLKLFVQHNGVGLLFDDETAAAFLKAAVRAADELGIKSD